MVVLDISGAVKSIHAVNKNHSRWIEPLLSQALSVFPVVVMAGARQVGKTTLVRDLCPGPKRRYHTLDSLDIRA